MILKFLKRYNYLFVVIVVGVAISCDNAQNHIELGDKFVLEGKPDKAIEEYKRAVALDTNADEIYYKLGDIYSKKENFSALEPYVMIYFSFALAFNLIIFT